MAKEVIYEKGREGDRLSSLSESLFNQVCAYNDKHNDQAHVVLLACDSKGGASFCIGDTKMHVKEFLESAARHEAFEGILIEILKKISE